MMFNATNARVFNRGMTPDSFLKELVEWGRSAYVEIFDPNDVMDGSDIYNKIKTELGPWTDLLTRRCAMLEVMRVLAGFESGWDWTEGVDTSRLGSTTPENAEAGAWQVSYGSRHSSLELQILLDANKITNGIQFQQAMKFNHVLAMDYVSRLMRHNTRENGPLYKGAERDAIRKSLRGPEQSIYPWLSRWAVEEFKILLS